MKVALLGPFPADVATGLAGGVDAVALALARGLAARPDVELHAVTAVPGLAAGQQITRDGFTLHRVPHPRGERLLWHQPLVRGLRRTLDAIGPDVIHAHVAGPYADAGLQTGRPTVITLHGVVFREAALALAHSSLGGRARWLVDAWYERWIVGRARHLVVISPYVAQEYRSLTRGRFHDIENPVADVFFGVPPPSPPPVSTGGGWGGGLLCVARLIPRKDILTLLDAFARIVADAPEATLEIAGQTDADPAYTAACLDAVRRLGLTERVRFLGGVGGQALVDCYARARVILLTSRQETAPVVVAEAMAAGRPVVATAVGGVPFMVQEGVTGFMAKPGDAAGLAQATSVLLAQPDRCRAFGQAGRAAAERRFRLATIVERTLALYREVIAEAAL